MYPTDFPFRNLEWKLLSQCNYKCWYCLDNELTAPCPGVDDADKLAEAFIRNLEKPWVTQITGGEPFLNPEFMIRLAQRLVEAGHWLKVFTNLSADISIYERFVEVTRGRLYKIKASFHMESADFSQFLDRATHMQARTAGRSKFKVFAVVLPGLENIHRLIQYRDQLVGNGIAFDAIHMIDPLTKAYYRYSDEERHLMESSFGSLTNKGDLRVDMQQCRSGHSYFVVTQERDAWSCWDARFRDDRRHDLLPKISTT